MPKVLDDAWKRFEAAAANRKEANTKLDRERRKQKRDLELEKANSDAWGWARGALGSGLGGATAGYMIGGGPLGALVGGGLGALAGGLLGGQGRAGEQVAGQLGDTAMAIGSMAGQRNAANDRLYNQLDTSNNPSYDGATSADDLKGFDWAEYGNREPGNTSPDFNRYDPEAARRKLGPFGA